MPYIEKTDMKLKVVTHGYHAINQEIQNKYSAREATAHRIGYLLAGVANPDRHFRSPQYYKEMSREIKDLGLHTVSQLKVLESTLKRLDTQQVSPEIANAGALVLIALADALDKQN